MACRHQFMCRMTESVFFPSSKQFALQIAADVGRKPFPLRSPHSDTLCGLQGLGGTLKEKTLERGCPVKLVERSQVSRA